MIADIFLYITYILCELIIHVYTLNYRSYLHMTPGLRRPLALVRTLSVTPPLSSLFPTWLPNFSQRGPFFWSNLDFDTPLSSTPPSLPLRLPSSFWHRQLEHGPLEKGHVNSLGDLDYHVTPHPAEVSRRYYFFFIHI